jgi:RNA polymerase sigma-70 factor (ECF subfamily)
VVLLRHVAGLDVQHTARVVGKKPGTVRVAAHRGLKRLADLLADQTGSAEADPSGGAPVAVPVGNATDGTSG